MGESKLGFIHFIIKILVIFISITIIFFLKGKLNLYKHIMKTAGIGFALFMELFSGISKT